MCGISGIYGVENLDDPGAIVRKMCDTLAHRGPDASGYFTDDIVALGHRRLSIIDTSAAANQPFYSADKQIVLVYNGELYNYVELKEQLSDFNFTTSCDTEVVIAAYQKWGIDFLEKLNGMFGFALYDKNSDELYIVRDRLGIKPLYVSQKGQQIVFASEIRALLSSGMVRRKVSPEAVVDYCRYQTVHAPMTILEDVEMMLPGHFIKVSDNEITTHQYWSPATAAAAPPATKAEAHKEIHDLMLSSTEMRMRADVPFGAFLSGGIDSSVIVGLMAKITDQPVSTFSVTFEENKFSEAPYSNMIAKKFATNHTEIKLSVNDFLKELPNALASMDHPTGDGPNTYVVSKVTKESGITMALSGLGGDELFAGYDVFKRMLSLNNKRWVMSFPKGLRNLGTAVLRLAKPGIGSEKISAVLANDYLDFEYAYPVNRQVFLDNKVAALMNRDSLPKNSNQQYLAETLSYGKPGFELPWLSKVSVAEMGTYMQNVLLRDTDQMSMAHALEVRVPFLDHRLVEYALSIDDSLKYPHSPKKLLVDSMGDLLPREIVDRPKMGFTFPWELWLKNELKGFAEKHLEALGKRPYFDAKELDKMWQKFLAGKVSWSRIWPLIVLENWMFANEVE